MSVELKYRREMPPSNSRQKGWPSETTQKGWSAQEWQRLKTLVDEDGVGDWQAKADSLGTGRSYKSVHQKYRREMEPSETRQKEWSAQEWQRLETLVGEDGVGDWQAKADSLGTGRSGTSVAKKYRREEGYHPGTDQKEWSAQEWQRLKTLVDQDGVGDWHAKADSLGTGRSAMSVAKKYRREMPPSDSDG
eukprot:COSAG04_NODE_237_length_19103_cov_15.726268_11_plen_191_part_00